jgi:hypothetical protein
LRISSGRTRALLRREMFFLKKSLDYTFEFINCIYLTTTQQYIGHNPQ